MHRTGCDEVVVPHPGLQITLKGVVGANAGTMKIMTRLIYLVDDDGSSHFAPRALTVREESVVIDGRELIPVSIQPPLESAKGGTLGLALLLPRSREASSDDIRHGPMQKPMRVSVYRIASDASDLPDDLTKNDVTVALWGLVGESVESLGRS